MPERMAGYWLEVFACTLGITRHINDWFVNESDESLRARLRAFLIGPIA